MQVHLYVYLDQPLLVDDGWLAQDPLPPATLAELRAQPYLGGELRLDDGSGAEPLVIGDDLEQLVPRLCAQSLAPLESGQAVRIDLFTDPASATLGPRPDGRLQVTAPDGRQASYDLAAAVCALEACGARYVRLIERCFADDASRQMKLAPMRVTLGRREDARAQDAPLMDYPPDAEDH